MFVSGIVGHLYVGIKQSEVEGHLYGPGGALPPHRVEAVYAVDDAEEEAGLDRSQSVVTTVQLRLPESPGFAEEFVSWFPVLSTIHRVAGGVQSTSQDGIDQQWRAMCLFTAGHILEEVIFVENGSPTILSLEEQAQ